MSFCKVNEKNIQFLFPIKAFSQLFSSLAAVQKLDYHDFRYADLQKNMCSHASSGCVQKAFEALNCMRLVPGKPTVNDYNALVFSGFKSSNVVCDDLVSVYFDMKKLGPSPNAATYNIVLNGLLSRGVFEHLVSISEEMTSSGFVPSFTIVSKMLKKFLEYGNLDGAFSLFKLMLKLDYFPTDKTLNMLIVRLSKAGKVSEAYFVFSVFLDQGKFPCPYNYNPILWALCRNGQSHTGLRLIYSLKKRGITHDARSYTALIYGFGKENLGFEALSCFKQMIREGCEPNVITHTVILKFFCDNGRIKEALDLLSAMEKKGPPPDVITYNVILRELSQQGKINEIVEIMLNIQEKGLIPDLFTHAALAGGLLKSGKIEMATEFLLDFTLRKGSLDVALCNIYINIRCQHIAHTNELYPVESKSLADKPTAKSADSVFKSFSFRHIGEALEIFDFSGIEPNGISRNTILKYLSASDIDMALELVDNINWGDDEPDIISFNTILSAACKKKNSPMIRRIFNRMEVENLNLNVVGSTCLIKYFVETGKISEGIQLLKEMILDSPGPNLVTFNSLINSLCKIGFVKVAYGVFRYMRSIGFIPDLITYNILLGASAREGNYQRMYHLLRCICMERLEPDSFTFSVFVYWLFKEGKISKALELRGLMFEVGVSPGIGVYNMMMKAMLERKKFSYVILLVKRMVFERCEPNAATFEIINRAESEGWIKGYAEANTIKSVLSNIGERKESGD